VIFGSACAVLPGASVGRWVLPLFHVFGLSSILNVCVRFGCTMSLIPRFNADTTLTAIERDGATIFEGYGMTETVSTTTFNKSITDRRAYSVGKPIWGTQTQVWDENGTSLPPGQDSVGEVVTRGMHVMKGYLNNPRPPPRSSLTAGCTPVTWGTSIRTGTCSSSDGRRNSSSAAGTTCTQARSRTCCCIPIRQSPKPRSSAYQTTALAKRSWPSSSCRQTWSLLASELIAYCRERMAAYKYPRVIEFRDDLPKNTLGKVLKGELLPR
jgi:long-chain acyl-CoA synthetase